MSGPLVDAEGFPRDDIDLYQVRTARHNIVCESAERCCPLPPSPWASRGTQPRGGGCRMG